MSIILLLAIATNVVFVLVSAQVPQWKLNLNSCWTDVTCRRAMVISHGGDWGLDFPYDSMPAFRRAVEDGVEAIKGDFRVAADNVGMVMHSSPVEWWESGNCNGVIVEQTPSEKLKTCTMALTNFTFIAAVDLLDYARDKAIVMFCVKEPRDIARAVSTLLENQAQDRAFLEIKVGDLIQITNSTVPNFDQVYFLAEADQYDDFGLLLSHASPELLARVFMVEFGPDWASWNATIMPNVTTVIDDVIHPRGKRTLTATSKVLPSVQEQQTYFDLYGFDVVYTYDATNAVQARMNVNTERGISPP